MLITIEGGKGEELPTFLKTTACTVCTMSAAPNKRQKMTAAASDGTYGSRLPQASGGRYPFFPGLRLTHDGVADVVDVAVPVAVLVAVVVIFRTIACFIYVALRKKKTKKGKK